MLRSSYHILFLFIVIGTVSSKIRKPRIDLTNVLNPDKTADPELYKKETAKGEKGAVGDMIVNGDSMNRNAVADPTKKWPRGIVPYVWDSSVDTPKNRRDFQVAVDEFRKYTCIKFVPRRNEEDYVKIRGKGWQCFAFVGRQGGMQYMTLSEGCYKKGTLLHEMMHTLGFHHEHNRSDRDKYITVDFSKLDDDFRSQYQKLDPSEEDNMGFPYDYSSVMHYGAFNIMTVKDKAFQYSIGQRAGFSKQDVQEINRYYACSGPGGTSGIEGVEIPKGPCEDERPFYCKDLNIVDGRNKWNSCEKDKVTVALCQKSCKKC